MFENIRKCLDEYEKEITRWDESCGDFDIENCDTINYFELNFAKMIMKDLSYGKYDEKVAKIILATKGVSNEIKVKVE